MKTYPFLEVVVRSYLKARRRPMVAPQIAPSPSYVELNLLPSADPLDRWSSEDAANEPRGFLKRLSVSLFALALAFGFQCATASVREVGPIELTVNNLDLELSFFTNTLCFLPISVSQKEGGTSNPFPSTISRTADLHLGSERIKLTEHPGLKGRPIPRDSRSYDHWFQHIAIVVSDMDKAYEWLRIQKIKHVSTGPQTLPFWNKDAGGIRAFYFRDPEDHVLEIIWFPAGKGDPKWQQPATNLFLGIDHTAIVVSDTDRSLAFYTNLLGMHVVGQAENYGVEQEHLNQVFGARLRITALRADFGPGIEFLEYITPPGGRPLPNDANENDLIFWQTWLHADSLTPLEPRLRASGATLLSRSLDTRQRIVRDPDGHALRLVDGPNKTRSATHAPENQ